MTAAQWIEVGGEVLAAIKEAAEPFVEQGGWIGSAQLGAQRQKK